MFRPMFNLWSKKQLIVSASNARRVFCYPPRFLELPHNASLVESDAAKVVATKVSIKSPEKSDLLLTLLKDHGLSDAHITNVVTKLPNILLAHPENSILPKLEFFHSIGMPPPALAVLVSRCPGILRCSLEKRIIPFYECLKNLLHEDEKVIIAFKQSASHFLALGLHQLPCNVAILRKYGVSESNISFLTANHPGALMIRSDELVKLVDRTLKFGICISSLMFVQAIQVLRSTSKSAWEQRKEVYCSWGWSESDFHLAFSIHPICMSLSAKNIMSKMEFLVNEMNCEPKAIARCPTVLLYSLEKRIMPRCRVVKLLMVKGLLKNSCNLVSKIVMTDKKFLEKFVTKNRSVPQLLDVYHGKLSLLDLGFNSSELANIKLLTCS